MHRRSSLLLLTLLGTTWLGCPLDIQVREEPCEGSDCQEPQPCEEDSECTDGWRCGEAALCEQGPRLGEPCEDFECQFNAVCHPLKHRCEYSCRADLDCPRGYRCSPDLRCIAPCFGTPPETLGLTCQYSTDCARCGVCVFSGGTKRCHQPCTRDEDCPGGTPGVCEQVGSGPHRACRLP